MKPLCHSTRDLLPQAIRTPRSLTPQSPDSRIEETPAYKRSLTHKLNSSSLQSGISKKKRDLFLPISKHKIQVAPDETGNDWPDLCLEQTPHPKTTKHQACIKRTPQPSHITQNKSSFESKSIFGDFLGAIGDFINPITDEKAATQQISKKQLLFGNTQSLHNLTEPKILSGASMVSTNDQSVSPQMFAERRRILQGLTPAQAMLDYESELTPFEQSELSRFPQIYTVGSVRVHSKSQIRLSDGSYRISIGEQLGYRYLVDQVLDAGAFGQVCRCIDMRDNGQFVAVKISRDKSDEAENGLVESRLLTLVANQANLVQMRDTFQFRSFQVIVFELLHINLYRHIKAPEFQGMPKHQLRHIVTQLLTGLAALEKLKVIHCDLKPENIMFTDPSLTQVKIVDFGSACTDFRSGFKYVQSRFYRSPEIVVGLPYDNAVDMWSLGCIIYELVTGRPLFPAHHELDLLDLITQRIGPLPDWMTQACSKKRMFFDQKNNLLRVSRGREKKLKELLRDQDPDFVRFLELCLQIEPAKRLKPREGLRHPWVKKVKTYSLFSENIKMTKLSVLSDLQSVMQPLPSKKHRKI